MHNKNYFWSGITSTFFNFSSSSLLHSISYLHTIDKAISHLVMLKLKESTESTDQTLPSNAMGKFTSANQERQLQDAIQRAIALTDVMDGTLHIPTAVRHHPVDIDVLRQVIQFVPIWIAAGNPKLADFSNKRKSMVIGLHELIAAIWKGLNNTKPDDWTVDKTPSSASIKRPNPPRIKVGNLRKQDPNMKSNAKKSSDADSKNDIAVFGQFSPQDSIMNYYYPSFRFVDVAGKLLTLEGIYAAENTEYTSLARLPFEWDINEINYATLHNKREILKVVRTCLFEKYASPDVAERVTLWKAHAEYPKITDPETLFLQFVHPVVMAERVQKALKAQLERCAILAEKSSRTWLLRGPMMVKMKGLLLGMQEIAGERQIKDWKLSEYDSVAVKKNKKLSHVLETMATMMLDHDHETMLKMRRRRHH